MTLASYPPRSWPRSCRLRVKTGRCEGSPVRHGQRSARSLRRRRFEASASGRRGGPTARRSGTISRIWRKSRVVRPEPERVPSDRRANQGIPCVAQHARGHVVARSAGAVRAIVSRRWRSVYIGPSKTASTAPSLLDRKSSGPEVSRDLPLSLIEVAAF